VLQPGLVPEVMSLKACGLSAPVSTVPLVIVPVSLLCVDERVHPAERALSGLDEEIVKKADDGREDRARAARAVNGSGRASVVGGNALGLSRDVGVTTSGRVVLARVLGANGLQVACHLRRLEGRDAEVVGEAAGGERCARLRRDAGRAANDGDVRAAGGEGDHELRAAR
jgi:hypothetical protein